MNQDKHVIVCTMFINQDKHVMVRFELGQECNGKFMN